MNGRNSRRDRIRKLAWALLALSWPASECLAGSDADSEVPAKTWGGPPDASQSSGAKVMEPAQRPKIPPPRVFAPGSLPRPRATAAIKIPPPRVFSAEEIAPRRAAPVAAPPREEQAAVPARAEVNSTPSAVAAPGGPLASDEAPAPVVPPATVTAPAVPAVEAATPEEAAQPQAVAAPIAPALNVEPSREAEAAPAPAAPAVPAVEAATTEEAAPPQAIAPPTTPALNVEAPKKAEAAPVPGSETIKLEEAAPPQDIAPPTAPALITEAPKEAAVTTEAAAPPQDIATPVAPEPSAEAPKDAVVVPIPAAEPVPPANVQSAQEWLEPQSSDLPSSAADKPSDSQATVANPTASRPESELSRALSTLAGETSDSAPMPTPETPAGAFAPLAKQNNPGEAQAPRPEEPRSAQRKAEAKQDDDISKTSCPTCGTFHSQRGGHVFSSQPGCASGNCIPGRDPCYLPASACNTVCGAFLTNLYQAICCPDPCYEPRWEPAAYASFFADYARPRTITRLRYDNLEAMTRPDRNQFWINQVKPVPQARAVANPAIRLQQLYLYQEAATERASMFVSYPYRQVNSNFAPTQAGFGDVFFGMKSLLFDQEILQVSFQLTTTMPSGNFSNNLGLGQFAIDPSVLASLKLSPTTYFQTQVGNWIPLGGPGVNRKLAGGIFYWFMSLNQVLWYMTPDSPLIATLEMDGWSFEDGGYTAAVRPFGPGPHPQTQSRIIPDGGGVSYFNIGPGLRQSICNRVDFGGAITWATDTAHWAQPWFRCEVRFLF